MNAFTVNFEAGYATSYSWDGVTRSWNRTIFGARDVTASGVQLSPKNVVVMSVVYRGGVGVEGSYAQMTGSGTVEVFTGGRVQRGTWSRKSLSRPVVYKNQYGDVIALTPGQTWVELLANTENVSITSKP